MDQPTDKKRDETSRVDAAALLGRLTGRALRLVDGDARYWGLGIAGLTGIVATFLTSPTFAATAAVVGYLTVSWFLRVRFHRRAPGVGLAARRVEALFPKRRGAATAALEDIGDSELAVETRRLAKTILTDAAKFSDEELYGILFGVGFDEETTRRRVNRRASLRRVATTLAGFAVATLGAVAIHGALRPPISQEPERPVAAGCDKSPSAPEVEPSADAASLGDEPTRVETSAAPSDELKNDLDKTVDDVAALVSDLERVANLARRLKEELDLDDGADLALAAALARELDAETATVASRASAVWERAATVLRDGERAADAPRAFLTVRRAREFVDFLRSERQARGTLASTLDASLRGMGNGVQGAVAALRDRFASEIRAFSILEESWRFKADEESASELDAALRSKAARLLALRAGATPGGAPETATRDFFELINRRREALAATTARFEETRRRLAAPESSEFVAFARRVAEDAGLVALCFDAGEEDPSALIEGASRRLDAAATEARLEHWGRVATILGADSRRDSGGATSETDALALRLTFGSIPARGPALDFETDLSVANAADIDLVGTFVGESFSRVDDATLREALEREGAAGDLDAFSKGADMSSRPDVAISDEEGALGSALETGARLDPQFVGGSDSGERDASSRLFSGASFNAELPLDERKRLEKAQKWSPPEEYLRRAETFRRNLQRAVYEKDGRRSD